MPIATMHPNDEATGLLGGAEPNAPDTWRFSIDVARAWERALDEAETPQTRKVALRSAMVMSPDGGGVFDTLLGSGAAWAGRSVGQRAAMGFLDTRSGLCRGRSPADRR